jgi:hypothetical protein
MDLRKIGLEVWIGIILLRIETSGEPLDSINGREFLDQLAYYQLFKDSSPCSYLDKF